MQTREVQGKLWSTSPADWVEYIEPTFIPMYQATFDNIQLDEEKALLDAGCGSGLFLSMASARGAQVFGIDAAKGLLEVTRKRLPQVSLLNEDLEALPFKDETFDVVTAFNSLQYAGSFSNALAEARRVTKKNGKLVVGLWASEKICESADVLMAVGSLLPPPPPGTPGPFALSEDGKVEEICKTVGLKVINKQTIFCPWQFIGNEALQKAFLCTAPCVKAVMSVGESQVRKTITESAQPYNVADGVYYMKNYFLLFTLEKI